MPNMRTFGQLRDLILFGWLGLVQPVSQSLNLLRCLKLVLRVLLLSPNQTIIPSQHSPEADCSAVGPEDCDILVLEYCCDKNSKIGNPKNFANARVCVIRYTEEDDMTSNDGLEKRFA